MPAKSEANFEELDYIKLQSGRLIDIKLFQPRVEEGRVLPINLFKSIGQSEFGTKPIIQSYSINYFLESRTNASVYKL